MKKRTRRYARDPKMEPFELLTDEDLAPLAEMLEANKRIGLIAFEHVRKKPTCPCGHPLHEECQK